MIHSYPQNLTEAACSAAWAASLLPPESFVSSTSLSSFTFGAGVFFCISAKRIISWKPAGISGCKTVHIPYMVKQSRLVSCFLLQKLHCPCRTANNRMCKSGCSDSGVQLKSRKGSKLSCQSKISNKPPHHLRTELQAKHQPPCDQASAEQLYVELQDEQQYQRAACLQNFWRQFHFRRRDTWLHKLGVANTEVEASQ